MSGRGAEKVHIVLGILRSIEDAARSHHQMTEEQLASVEDLFLSLTNNRVTNSNDNKAKVSIISAQF